MTVPQANLGCGRFSAQPLLKLTLFALATLTAGSIRVAAADSVAAASTGVVTGIVTNKTTGNGLEGAVIDFPRLGISTQVDKTGRYITSVPAGTHEMVVTYSGMDPQRATVLVTGGQQVVRDFVMTSEILMLDAYKVAAEKEGLSLALTQQKNADNLKSVASMDALRDLPNMNATELALRLPGVAFGNPGDEVVEVVSVRGTGAGMTSITIDGGGMSSFSAANRNTRMTAFTGAMFESLELVKGQTPDRSVDSLGGNINFKTRSPLSMREKRRINYSFTARMAPWFTEQVPLREAHRTHAMFNGQYQEKFAMFGSTTENLAVSLNLFYSENAFGFFRTQRDYQQTNTQPAYLWDYRTQDNYNNRRQQNVATKFDFRPFRNTLIRLNLIYNDAPEPMRRQYQVRAFAGSATTTPNATTSGVVAGAFTDRVTVVRAVPTPSSATYTSTAAALIDQTSTLINRDQRLRHFDISGEHTFNRIDLDWSGLWSRTRYRTLGREGVLVSRIGNIPFVGPNGGPGSPANNIKGPNGETGVGWILDRTESDLYPKFIQNGGLDFTNPNNYRPQVNGLSTGAGNLDIDMIRELKGNARFRLPIDVATVYLKTGASVRDHTVEAERRNRRWSYIGAQALPSDPSILLWDQVKTHRNMPIWEAAQFIQNGQPVDPSLWQEDQYYYYSNRLLATNKVNELINGLYGMTQGRWGRFGFLGGVRWEETRTRSVTRARVHTLSTAAQQLADPIGSAEHDYSIPYDRHGYYAQSFPSAHLWYNLTPDLKLRGSWSTGFARPSLSDTLPPTSSQVNETNQTVTIGNPDLKPEKAKNWDFSLEYYYKSSSISVGWFHKTIDDFWASAQEVATVGGGQDNGFNGDYQGFHVLQKINAGTAIIQGWEFNLLQQFRFLPGPLKTLRLTANATLLHSHGTFGGDNYLVDSQVQNFIPRTGNIGLSWDYRKFGVSVSYNYTSENIRTAYNVANPSRNQYMEARELVNASMRYQLRPNLTLTFGVQNLFNAPQIYYRGFRDQLETFLVQGTTITAGVEGRF